MWGVIFFFFFFPPGYGGKRVREWVRGSARVMKRGTTRTPGGTAASNLTPHTHPPPSLSAPLNTSVEPFSVKHDYDKNPGWNSGKPVLTTCNPGSMQYVTHGMAPQLIDEGEEVRGLWGRRCGLGGRGCAGEGDC